MKSNYIVYKDPCLKVFHDKDNSLLIFVAWNGKVKVISYDDNFYTIEELINAYTDLIELATSGPEEKEEYIKDYVKFILKQNKDINIDLLNSEIAKKEVLRQWIKKSIFY